jgi:hypothetical protein
MTSPTIHDSTWSHIFKKRHPKSYRSDVKYHMKLKYHI